MAARTRVMAPPSRWVLPRASACAGGAARAFRGCFHILKTDFNFTNEDVK